MPQGNVWNLPNYIGELFEVDKNKMTFFNLIGGLNKVKITPSKKFAVSQTYSTRTPGLNAKSEKDAADGKGESLLAKREQQYNITEIHQEKIDLTYHRQANQGMLSGLNQIGGVNPVGNEKAFQINNALKTIKQDLNYSYLNGEYNEATNETEIDKTRGIIQVCKDATGNSLDAELAGVSQDMMNAIFKIMFDAGAPMDQLVILAGSDQILALNNVYEGQKNGNKPASMNIGGFALDTIVTPFGKAGIMAEDMLPNDTILIADIAQISPTFAEVPGKGILFTEPLAKVGASDQEQLYCESGLDYGPYWAHAVIHNLKV